MPSPSVHAVLLLTTLLASSAQAAPNYQLSVLESVYPAGGRRGTTVAVSFLGPQGSFKGANEIVIDGPPGVTAKNVKAVGDNRVEAELVIAADAPPGRRMLRVQGGPNGLTNFRWFHVTDLPEHVEARKNDTPGTAEPVTTPLVVNGRVEKTLDQDCFRFQANAGEKIVAAVLSHGLDAMGYGRNDAGFADTTLELLDAAGNVLAESGDAIGFDPLIHFEIPADGEYVARVSGMGYRGFPQMVYRLTLGAVPYPTAVFPVAGRRGTTVEIEISGPNVPPGTTQRVTVGEDSFPWDEVNVDGPCAGVNPLPLLRTDSPQITPAEPPSARESASELPVPCGVSGRFEQPGERHWYRLTLEEGARVALEVTAQRHLRSAVDTLLEVYDPAGEVVARNDDGELFQGECTHDFVAFDSRLEFTAKQAGTYLVAVAEQSGAAGARAQYHLDVSPAAADFRLYQWPDAVPVWGPGTTAAFVVEIHRLGGLTADVEIAVEGLPAGWTGSAVTAFASDYKPPRGAFGQKVFLTITAPADAAVGDVADFQVVGRAVVDGHQLRHDAQPLTQYLWQEPHRFRVSPRSRAHVAAAQGPSLTAETAEITARAGETVRVPVRVDAADGTKLTLSINRASTHFRCALGPPVSVTVSNGTVLVPVPAAGAAQPAVQSIVIADAWASETRKGLPGPCTRPISLMVRPK